jgi:NAD(P)-dependent dehydrogenase (short-subunit alcohol dehydrogenase family)
MELGLGGRRAVVTGGTKGIGRAVVQELLAEGASVAFCARSADQVEESQKSLRYTGAEHDDRRVFGWAADVTIPNDVDRFIEVAAATLGGIDILVNNAGAAHPGGFEDLTDADWYQDIDLKLFSQIRCTRAALPYLRRSTAARVINVNSVYGKYPDPAFFATTVNRAACMNLTKALAQQLAAERILVNSVNIGFVITPQWESIREQRAPDATPDEFFASWSRDEVPLGRFGSVEEVSGVVAFLASDRASYVTGAMVDVAGGMGKYV